LLDRGGGYILAKKNDDFFKEKKSWSEVKDALLGNYLKPYLQKILHTRKAIVYVDCFAGKGVFEDGQPGSPLIALQTMQDCLNHTTMSAWRIEPFFIDLNYADDLKVNLKKYPGVKIISGKYEDEICTILENKKGCNIFLYVDPYGIKALDCSLFDNFATHGFNSIELLINMNSFGFIREGCRVLGVNFDDNDIFEDLVEYDSTRLTADEKSQWALNKIAGGDYWIHIIEAKRRNVISAYDAEAQFADEYCKRLRKSYSYVLNMPLRIKRGQVPKYRMIHATNHADGALLMVDNIFGRWELMKDIQTSGQMQLWEENIENETVDESDIQHKIIEHVSTFQTFTRLNRVMADFYSVYGVICRTKSVKDVYRDLEKSGELIVQRTPSTTPTGRPATYFADEKGKQTELRWKG